MAHPHGTTVAVRDLFFNLPARRRFLRSARTEQQQILTTLQRLALSRFDVRFQCDLNGQQKLNLPIAGTQAQQLARVGKICGQAFVKQALVIDQQFDFIDIKGWLGHTETHRPQADQQYFFINGRVIRDRLISQVIRQAYAELIPPGRHPVYVLYMTIPLDRVDVNVHPTKHEVRFRETRLIHGLIHRAVSDELHQQINTKLSPTSSPVEQQIAESSSSYQRHNLSSVNAASPIQTLFPVNHAAPTDAFQLVQLLHQRFAWVRFRQQNYLIDLPKALADSRQQQFASELQQLPLKSRPILVPLNIACTAAQQKAVTEHQSLLNEFGFELQPQDMSLTIKKIPIVLAQLDLNTMLSSVIDALNQKNIDAISLGQHLLNLLHTTDQLQLQQAEQWLQNASPQKCIEQPWCRELDLLTLGSLFSD